VHDRAALAVDARLEEAVDRVQEVVAVELRVEAQDACAEQAFEQLLAVRADPEQLAVGPGDVPERDHGRARQRAPDQRRRERIVVVLHEDDRVVGIDLLEHRAHEPLVDGAVVQPVLVAEDRARVRDVAQRPQALVGEAVVVAALLLDREPHAPQLVRALARRHAQAPAAPVAVGRLAVARAAAVRDPGARAGAQNGLERVTRPLAGVHELEGPPPTRWCT
jgi:hypothetical protein